MSLKFKIFLIIIFVFSFKLSAQEIVEPSPIKWYSIQEVEELHKKQPKPWLIDIYTDWCGWCKHMMKTTFANKGIANYINTHFYPVRFNAETKDTITFNSKKYINKNKTHDLALELLNNRPSYPTIVYFDIDGRKYPIPGYMKSKEIEPLLIYFVENVYKNTTLNEFNVLYQFAFPETFKEEIKKIDKEIKPDTTGQVKWMTFEEAFLKFNKKPKKILIDIYVDWCHSCKVMRQVSYRDKKLADYINKNFYPIQFNAASTDTIQAFGKTFYSLGKGQPHQLAQALLNQKYIFPSTMIFNTDLKAISLINFFISPRLLKPIFKYYNEDEYKTKTFDDFLKSYKE